jgi:hypothetical protein
MFDLKALTDTVQKNCHISDAQFAGQYTLCIFLLKMREYYRWEKGIPQSHALPSKAVGAWLTARESFWEELESLPFSPISIDGHSFDPFETDAINTRLNPLGYVYSGGIGIFHKPYFFLGKLEKKTINHETTLLISSTEYARDLAAPPAMLLDKTIFIRQESLRRFIWEKIEEWNQHKNPDTPMARALACYHEANIETVLDRMTTNELASAVLHETGEARATQLLGDEWEILLNSLPRSRAELLIRAVRDHLADSLSTLPALLAQENFASLHFYFANFTGLRNSLFPEALQAYQDWVKTGDLSPLEGVYQNSQHRWHQEANKILALYRDHSNNHRQTDRLANALEDLYPFDD